MEAQVLELPPLVASGLRSGFGLIQALTNASDQMKGPLRVEMDHMLSDIQVGSSIEDAFEGLRERVGSSDFDIVVTRPCEPPAPAERIRPSWSTPPETTSSR